MLPPTAQPSPQSAISIDALHRDIALANQYRLDLIKLLMTLSAALLAFTISFRPGVMQPRWEPLMWVGWLALGVSMVGGMVHMLGWDRFYTSYRNYDWRDHAEQGKTARAIINLWRRFAMLVQYFGFALGVLAIALFAAVNLDHFVPKP